MISRRTLWVGIWILLVTFALAACDVTGDAPAGLDNGQILNADVACTDTDPHPVGESIANQFDVEYEQVMAWFCSGQQFDDILLALQSAELSGRDPGVLLRESDNGWENVWANDGTVDPDMAGVDMGSGSPFDDRDGGDLDDDPSEDSLDDEGALEWDEDEFEIEGTVRALDSTVRALSVHVEQDDASYVVLVPGTLSFELVQVGDRVEIHGFRDDDGDLVATELEVKGGDDFDDDGDDDLDADRDDDFDDDRDDDFDDRDDDFDDDGDDDFDDDRDDDFDGDGDDFDDDRDDDFDDDGDDDFDGDRDDDFAGEGDVVWNGSEFRLVGIITDKAEGQRAILVQVAGPEARSEAYLVSVPHEIAFEELREGQRVEVEGIREADGELFATEIEVQDGRRGDLDDDFDDDDLDDDFDDDDLDDDFDDDDLDDDLNDDDLDDDFNGDRDVTGEAWNVDSGYCRNLEDEHPVGWAIADRYDVAYVQVMEWFCADQLGMGEIMLALQTADATNEPAEVYVQRRLNGEGWGQIWQELGLIGRPEDALPPGLQRDGDNPGKGNEGEPPGQQKDKENPGKGNDGAPPGQQKDKDK